MTTQTIERERVKYTDEFLERLKSMGIEIPKFCLYVRKNDDDE